MMLSSPTQLQAGKEQWSVYRRYEQFHDLHKKMKMTYPEVRTVKMVLSDISPDTHVFHAFV